MGAKTYLYIVIRRTSYSVGTEPICGVILSAAISIVEKIGKERATLRIAILVWQRNTSRQSSVVKVLG